MIERLFVYGTLQPGGPIEHLLAEIGGEWEPGTIRGQLKDFGWGAEYNYPGLIIDELADEVEGFVFTSRNLRSHWKALDEFEGSEYKRIVAPVTLQGGKQVDVQIYVLDLPAS